MTIFSSAGVRSPSPHVRVNIGLVFTVALAGKSDCLVGTQPNSAKNTIISKICTINLPGIVLIPGSFRQS